MATGADSDWFAELQSTFLRGSADRLATLARLLTLLEMRPDDDAVCRDLMQQFHKLAGSGATFRFEEVSRLAREGEALCEKSLCEPGGASAAMLAVCRDLHASLARELGRNAAGPAPMPAALPGEAAAGRAGIDVLVVEDDDDLRGALVGRLSAADWSVRSAVTLAQGLAAVDARLPDALVTDIRLPDGSGFELIERVRALPGGDGAVIVAVSARAGFFDRVQALRSGADVAYPKPFDLGTVSGRLEELLERARAEQPRVLVVEDDPDHAAFLRTVLSSAGYEVRVCEDPRDLEADMVTFLPEIVLMDILLPRASGHDLVRYLRQDPRFSSIPVLVVTSEGLLGDRIRSARAGGDDHLVKPVAPALLLASVASRVERGRLLRRAVDRDGLTGLLTRSAFAGRAEAKVASLRRRPSSSAVLVMLDLDRFHELNERYGHPEGDRVLASLGALLRKRFRRSDTLGRYGGEEFALLLEDLGEADAFSLMERVLGEFSDTELVTSRGEPFAASFSAGLAEWGAHVGDLPRWIAAADDALYRAKAAGRRRVARAGP